MIFYEFLNELIVFENADYILYFERKGGRIFKKQGFLLTPKFKNNLEFSYQISLYNSFALFT